MKQLKTFLKIFYAHRFFRDFNLLYPVYMLLFASKGLSVFEITWLMIIWSISVFVLEIPSGMLADRWGRKQLIVIGTAFKLISLAFWLMADGFLLFALGFVFWGVQEALCSGSTEALLYDMLSYHGEQPSYEKRAGRASFFAGLGLAVSMLFGGFVASAGFDIATWVSIGLAALALLFASLLDNVQKAGETTQPRLPLLATLKDGLMQCRKSPMVLLLLAFSAFIAIAPGVLEEYDQLYAHGTGLSLGLVGIWGGARTIIEAAGSWFAHKLKKLFGSAARVCLLAALGGILLYAGVFSGLAVLLPVYALFYTLTACGAVLAESMLQRQIDSSHRATVLSINSLLINVTSLGLYLGFAAVEQISSLRGAFIFIGVYTVIVALLLAVVAKKAIKPHTG